MSQGPTPPVYSSDERKIHRYPLWVCIAIVMVACVAVTLTSMRGHGWSAAAYASGVQHGKEVQGAADHSCPFISAATINSVIGYDMVAMSHGNNCAFMHSTYSAVTINWQSDPQGVLFERNVQAVNAPTFSLGGVKAAALIKATGMFFDFRGRLIFLEVYGLPMRALYSIANAVVGQPSGFRQAVPHIV